MKIALTVGHSILKNGLITSADGIINEYKYCKEIAPLIKKYLEQLGHSVELIICPEKVFNAAADERSYKLNIVNDKSRKFDLVVELHLNAFKSSTANGTEVYYYSNAGKVFADRVQAKMVTKFKDRKVQQKSNLYILNSTTPPAILLELFFCTNAEDVETGKDMNVIARLVAEGIAGKELKEAIKTPTKTITKESTTDDVKWLQKHLNSKLDGQYLRLKTDGIYGNKTRIAVLIYWESLGWNKEGKDDGWRVGVKTINSLA